MQLRPLQDLPHLIRKPDRKSMMARMVGTTALATSMVAQKEEIA